MHWPLSPTVESRLTTTSLAAGSMAHAVPAVETRSSSVRVTARSSAVLWSTMRAASPSRRTSRAAAAVVTFTTIRPRWASYQTPAVRLVPTSRATAPARSASRTAALARAVSVALCFAPLVGSGAEAELVGAPTRVRAVPSAAVAASRALGWK